MINQQAELEQKIVNLIRNSKDKKITFYDFMKMALYENNLGYYTREKNKIGKDADFYTSSSVGSVYGKTIANNFIELLPFTTDDLQYNILEIGGGNGQLAKDILDEIKRINQEMYNGLTYYMLETSPYHKILQEEKLKEHINKLIWLNNITDIIDESFKGIVFSNELYDALPVHRVKQESGKLKEIYIIFDESEKAFSEFIDELSDLELAEYFLKQNIQLREGQIAEVNLDAIKMFRDINQILEKGYILTIDYGYLASELYDSNRMKGTLACYYKHTVNDNPYQNIGQQDITSHVNFSALIDHGIELGIENICFTYQSKFLLNNGILNYFVEIDQKDLVSDSFLHNRKLKMNRAIRQLITPDEMGETFKILLQQKGIKHHNYNFLLDIWEKP